MNPAINIQNLSKQYHIKKNGVKHTFNALKDINLDIPEGQVLGIIGKNGSGKSTLLKILSRITYPSSGEVSIYGRLASLLEVGTGFHPELSGRENIFLNGSILGMTRAEIQNRFDEIVAFSGVQDFLDTPVKHYSSGMYVRLAFAVAAHLSADILLIDEVLAVGDAEFQKKCLQTMDTASKTNGRTIVFVSHNMSAIRSLCKEVVWLEKGEIKQMGATEEVCDAYLRENQKRSKELAIHQRLDREGLGEIRFTNCKWVSKNNALVSGKKATLEITYNSEKEHIHDLQIRINLLSHKGTFLTTLRNEKNNFPIPKAPGKGLLHCVLDEFPLMQGSYYLTLSLRANGELQDRLTGALYFEVAEGEKNNQMPMKRPNQEGVFVVQTWETNW
jgi:lipopolysaccharide transport system ATP-binding protein